MYRYLQPGEMLRKGDEFQYPSGEWGATGDVGNPVPTSWPRYRRPLSMKKQLKRTLKNVLKHHDICQYEVQAPITSYGDMCGEFGSAPEPARVIIIRLVRKREPKEE